MTRHFLASVITFTMCIWAPELVAQGIDLDMLVRDIVNYRLPQDRELEEANRPLLAKPVCINVPVCEYGVDEVVLLPVDVKLSETKPAAIPESVVTKRYTLPNCTKAPMTVDDEYKFETWEGASFVQSSRFVTTQGSKNKSSLKVPIGKATLGLEKEFSFSTQESEQSTQENDRRRTVTEIQKINVSVPPMTTYVLILEKRLQNDYMDVDATVLVDGRIYVDWAPGERRYQGLMSTQHSPERRSLNLKGQIYNVSGQQITRRYLEIPLTQDSEQCQN